MRMIIIILLVFAAGFLAGDRYGAPDWARKATGGAFSAIDGWAGRKDAPTHAEALAPDESADESAPASSSPRKPSGDAANAGLHINDAGLAIIKDSEGLRLEAYFAGGGWFIGYGHSGTAQAGMVITEEEAERLLREDIQDAEDVVRALATRPVNRNQFSAMTSLAFNLGGGAFSRSQVIANVNDGDFDAAADAFRNHNKAGGVVSTHLTERREKERALFLTPA